MHAHGPHAPRPSTSFPTRRSFLQTAAAATAGVVAPGFFAKGLYAFPARPRQGVGATPRASSVIHLFLPGGIAHQESFDPKPYAPVEYRGPLTALDTRLTGVQFSQHFDRLAKIADRLTVLRSLTHGEAAHERGTHNLFTGYRPSPALQYPSFGSVVSHELGGRNDLPAYVCVPGLPNVYAGCGYLPSAYNPFSLGDSPESPRFAVRDLEVPAALDAARDQRRRELLARVDEDFSRTHPTDAVEAMSRFYEQAFALIDSPTAREAFRIQEEPEQLRRRYGANAGGQRLLLARRLVEAGVRFVCTTIGGWDHHLQIAQGFRRQGPELDQALATLIEDLDERGLLDTTLVVVTSEFGRTPKLNSNEGRDHWPRVFSALLAGGGVKRGHVHGSSDALAAEPKDDPLSIEDFATTIYSLIGIDSDKELVAPGGRPIEIVKSGHVVQDLLS